jgi:hypothetical protein
MWLSNPDLKCTIQFWGNLHLGKGASEARPAQDASELIFDLLLGIFI